mgnify:CR=1 FL=1
MPLVNTLYSGVYNGVISAYEMSASTYVPTKCLAEDGVTVNDATLDEKQHGCQIVAGHESEYSQKTNVGFTGPVKEWFNDEEYFRQMQGTSDLENKKDYYYQNAQMDYKEQNFIEKLKENINEKIPTKADELDDAMICTSFPM